MPSEITINSSLAVAKSTMNLPTKGGSFTADLSGKDYSAGRMSVPTTANGTALTLATAVGTPGWAYFKNHDASNFITIGGQTGGTLVSTIKLLPGEFVVVRLALAANAIYAISDTAACDLEWLIVEA